MELENKKVTVIGLGKSGFSAAKLLASYNAKVKVTDIGKNLQIKKKARVLEEMDIEVETGKHSREMVRGQDLIVVSPGVNNEAYPVKYAYENDIPVIGEVELGYRCCKTPIIAVSGTNGKTTVTTMLDTILEKADINSVLCGNVGNPITEVIKDRKKNSFLVLEVSSFQLQRIERFRPSIGILLEVTRDHLNRHKNEFSYKSAKYNLFTNQTEEDWAIIVNPDKNFIEKKDKFIYLNEAGIHSASRDFYKKSDEEIDDILKNKKIDINRKIVLLVLWLLNKDIRCYLKTILEFKNLPHRLEFVTKIKEVTFVNDSKSTNISSTIWALKKYDNVILIAGGRNKNLNFDLIPEWFERKIKHLIVMGESADEIGRSFKDICPVYKVNDLNEAVKTSYELADFGDNVLLSPMCASFDMFSDYKERGNIFKQEIDKLKKLRKKA